jgi:L-aspartate oxidase
MANREFDFLVIGCGIAGLTYAIEASKAGSVAVLAKKQLWETSTAAAQGGVAAVTAEDDDFALHTADTMTAGAGLCKKEVVEIVVKEGPERIRELIAMGVRFDRMDDDSGYHLHREGGHSRRRIFHAADATGSEIQDVLLKKAKQISNIQFFENTSAVDLITTNKLARWKGSGNGHNARAVGAYVLMPDGSVEAFLADKILVATGGAGKVYLYTSNPDVASGDGIAMCFRAGAPVGNMEFFQFHPTCLYHPKAKSFLISEAMRGEGALLRRMNGELFMHKYHQLKELAPRDIVARAIDHEMKLWGEDHVLLDITHRPADFIKEHFPTIYQKCLEFGIDISSEPIPVVPAAHYLCGGVVSDHYGRTSIESLFVAGECACTGLHGANRLASNSLLEGLVFGHRAAQESLRSLRPKSHPDVPPWNPLDTIPSDEQVVISQNWIEIRTMMWNYVGIVRSNKRLERALRRSELIEHEIKDYYWNFKITPDLLELRNLSLVANLVIRSAIQRKESRGLHYNLDYPEISKEAAVDTVIEPATP